MAEHDAEVFHRLYGIRKPRTCYYRRDFVDYTLMILATALVAGFCYGFRHWMALAAYGLSAFMLSTFIVRHGVELRIPLILRRPQDVLHTIVYRLLNLKPIWFIAVGLLLLEYVLIAATPKLPHHVEWMRTTALWLFYAHFAGITLYRTASLVDHLAKKEMVREILMQTPWKRTITRKTNIALEIVHAYVTGLLTHILLIGLWYFVLTHVRYSLLFAPVIFVIDVGIEMRWYRTLNRWFYREHWVAHNSELEFLYLHGGHHDAIPSGMIAVSENGLLEGPWRFLLGPPMVYYQPFAAALLMSHAVWYDMLSHQYIPGVYPRPPKPIVQSTHHSTHHFGQLAPYGLAIKTNDDRARRRARLMPREIANSIELDEELSGYEWDNPTFRNLMSLFERYSKRKTAPGAEAVAAEPVQGSPS